MIKKSTQLPILALLLGPALIIFTFFVIIPVFQAAYFSLYKWNGLGPLGEFRGLKNFQVLFATPIFHKALTNNLIQPDDEPDLLKENMRGTSSTPRLDALLGKGE